MLLDLSCPALLSILVVFLVDDSVGIAQLWWDPVPGLVLVEKDKQWVFSL